MLFQTLAIDKGFKNGKEDEDSGDTVRCAGRLGGLEKIWKKLRPCTGRELRLGDLGNYACNRMSDQRSSGPKRWHKGI